MYYVDGVKQTGWKTYNGKRYYLQKNGAMMAGGTLEIDSVLYVFDDKGVCQNPNG